MRVEPVVLQNEFVRLEPTTLDHAEALARHATVRTFDYFTAVRLRSEDPAGVREFITALQAIPDTLFFTQILAETGEPVGMTSYLDIREEHRGLEVGYTWIGERYRGTAVNPSAKLLLLEHAFERLECVRVQLKCDARNLQSRAAILKLGAKLEGILRKHVVLPDGFVRDTAMHSIVAEEWPEVKAGLERRLAAIVKQPCPPSSS